MGRIDSLVASYRRHLALPLTPGLPLSQRVWFAVYPPEEERRLATKIEEFEIVTKEAQLGWCRLDLSGVFADWLDTFEPDERAAILADVRITDSYADPGFREFICSQIEAAAAAMPVVERPRTVLALTGLMELYDFAHISDVVGEVDKKFPGVLLVFFPGEREGNTYRFLGARDGWDYLAVPLLAET